MKKITLFLILCFLSVLLSLFLGVGGIKSNPFPYSMERTHPLEIIWGDGDVSAIGGVGTRQWIGFPCQFLIIDTGSSDAARATIQGETRSTRIDSWRFKLDIARLLADVLLIFVTTFVLSKALALLVARRTPRLGKT